MAAADRGLEGGSIEALGLALLGTNQEESPMFWMGTLRCILGEASWGHSQG